MTKTMHGVSRRVFSHLGQASAEPVNKLIFHERSPGAVGRGELENQVRGARGSAPGRKEAIQGSDGAKQGTRGSGEMDLMDPFTVLNSLGQYDGDDDAVVDPPDLLPSELAEGVDRSVTGREEVAPPQHCEKQNQGCIFEGLKRDELDQGGTRWREREEQVGEDLGGHWTAPAGGGGKDPGGALDNGEKRAVLRGARDPVTPASGVHPQSRKVLAQTVRLSTDGQNQPDREQTNLVRRGRELVNSHLLGELKVSADLDGPRPLGGRSVLRLLKDIGSGREGGAAEAGGP